MTKKVLLMLLSMFSLVCMFASCNDDDKIEIIQDGEFVGVYKGALDVKLGGLEVAKDMPQKIYITLVADAQNQIKMELKNFSFGSMVLGDIAVDKCDVIKKGNTCTFTGNQKLTLPVIGECDVKLKGSIINDKIQLDIDVAATEAGSAIQVAVVFNGTKLTTDQSSAAKIESFTFESKYVTSQPVIEGKNITFIVADTIPAEALAALVPTFTISAKATVTPASGVAQDFSKPVTYKVTSEDGIVITEYTVSVAGKQSDFDFEEWTIKKDPSSGSTEQFEIPVGTWGTTNDGVLTINYMFGEGFGKFEYPVAPTADAKEGKKAVSIKTLYTFLEKEGTDFNALFGGLIPYVTAGSLFQGSFKTDMSDVLNSTKFGVPFNRKPITFTGWYKYTPGEVYYSNKNKVVDLEDKCAIYALLYEEELDGKGNNIYLNGSNIRDSKRIILEARLEDGSAKSEWTKFELPFEVKNGKSYDASKKYYLTFVCTSSFEGDTYNGAPGSLLIVDDFQIISE